MQAHLHRSYALSMSKPLCHRWRAALLASKTHHGEEFGPQFYESYQKIEILRKGK